MQRTKRAYWSESGDAVLANLNSRPEGLTSKEAKARLETYGPNAITERQRLTRTKIFLEQFQSPLILILIVAGAGTIFLQEWVETGVIFAAVLVNALLGFWQENKAEEIFALLKSYIRSRARVRRNGNDLDIESELLVPGDIIRISQGDRVPADGRIIFASNAEVDESILTGESLPVKKDKDAVPVFADLGDRTPMVWSGTLFTGGFADVVVIATGNKTEFGKIASSIENQPEEKTPLQIAVSKLAAFTGVIVLFLTLMVFAWGLLLDHGLFETFLLGVAIAVSAVPEGLPVALTVILAVGSERIGRKKGVVRKLLATETLGSTSIIFTDKTGTLTQAKMQLSEVLPEGPDRNEQRLLRLALMNTDVIVENPEEQLEKWRIVGRGIEPALVRGAAEKDVNLFRVRKEFETLDRLPFNSKDKFSAVLVNSSKGAMLLILGAPDVLLEHSKLDPAEKDRLLKEVERLAGEGKRVLGSATKPMAAAKPVLTAIQSRDWNFEGLLTFVDPLRPDAKEAIAKVEAAGIMTVILTGDHRGTAESVGRELGIFQEGHLAIAGAELDAMSDKDILAKKKSIRIFARVTPEHKLRLVNLYRKSGEVVAMIGDGVNDAPALKDADIGVSVGSGTDIAKGAADLVLLDDNFGTLVAAIEEGRKILANIRKVVVYLMSNVCDALFIIGGSLFFGIPLPITALQILFVNFFTDSFPAVAFAFEEGVDRVGNIKKRLTKNLFDVEVRFLVLVVGMASSIFLFLIYYWLLKAGYPENLVRTFLFGSFATYTLFLAFAVRSLERPLVSYNPLSNKYLTLGAGFGVIATFLVIYVPVLQRIFGTTSLPFLWAIGVIFIGLLNIAAVEFGKWLYRNK